MSHYLPWKESEAHYKKQDRFTTCFKTCGTSPLVFWGLEWVQIPFGVKATQTDRQDSGATRNLLCYITHRQLSKTFITSKKVFGRARVGEREGLNSVTRPVFDGKKYIALKKQMKTNFTDKKKTSRQENLCKWGIWIINIWKAFELDRRIHKYAQVIHF